MMSSDIGVAELPALGTGPWASPLPPLRLPHAVRLDWRARAAEEDK